jgi:hypothetical protein
VLDGLLIAARVLREHFLVHVLGLCGLRLGQLLRLLYPLARVCDSHADVADVLVVAGGVRVLRGRGVVGRVGWRAMWRVRGVARLDWQLVMQRQLPTNIEMRRRRAC